MKSKAMSNEVSKPAYEIVKITVADIEKLVAEIVEDMGFNFVEGSLSDLDIYLTFLEMVRAGRMVDTGERINGAIVWDLAEEEGEYAKATSANSPTQAGERSETE